MQFTVNTAEVAAASARTRASVEALRTEASAMMGHLIALQSSWTGGASAAFAGAAEQWQVTQRVVEDNLSMISLALDQAAASYAETEATATRLFTG